MDHYNARFAADASDRGDVTQETEAQLPIKRRVDRSRWTHQEERVTICGGTHDGFSRDIAACAWPVLDYKLLSETIRQPFRHQSRKGVARTARGKTHNDADWPHRIGLGPCERGQKRKGRSMRGDAEKLSAREAHCNPLFNHVRAARTLSRMHCEWITECRYARIMLYWDRDIPILSWWAMQLSDRIGRRMKLHDLHVLMTVVQAGSMSKAATLLNTRQPAISRSIADLEHAIGQRLLERNRQGVQPTEYGRALLAGGVAMFDDLRQAIKNIEFLADPTVGEIRVGSNEAIIGGLLPTVFGRLRRQYPGISIHVTQVATALQRYRELRDRNVDLILSRLAGSIEDDIAAEILFHDRIVVAAGSRNRWTRRRKIKLAELADQPWSVPAPDTPFGSLVAHAFRASGMKFPPKGVAFGTTHLNCALLAREPFLSIFPRSFLQFGTNLPSLRVLPVELPIPPWPVGIMTLKSRPLSPVVKLFIERTREVIKPLARLRS